MEAFYVLLFVIILEFVYIVYQDWVNRQERERLELKIMSKSVVEYKDATEKPAPNMIEKDDPSMDLDDVDDETLITAKDNL